MLEPLEFHHPRQTEQQMTTANCQQGYPPPTFQYPAYSSYSEKLYYEKEKAGIEVQKSWELCSQRLELERLKQELKLRNKVRQEMLSFEIFRDAMGRIVYSRVGSDQEKFCSKILLNILKYKAVNFWSASPHLHMVLSISWEGCREPIYFQNTAHGIPVQNFLKRLKSKGVLFRVSKRSEREVADALLAYSLNTQEEYEIPFFRGWNLMGNGRWHFAKKDEITMGDILNNEY